MEKANVKITQDLVHIEVIAQLLEKSRKLKIIIYKSL